jgi:dihydroorotate dehydrogenase (NAD+) catalytic subunit
MADRPEETLRMVRMLEGVENVMAVEFGFAPQLAGDIILLAVAMCQGELPVIVALPPGQVLTLGPQVMDAGAAAVSLGAPRGMLGGVTGRLYGPGLLVQSLLAVRDAARLGLPVIGAGGVYCQEDANAMLAAGALAVQVDAALWRGEFSLAV